jgi:N-acetylglucosaminyldiphosphoundecaprenol N-acetyl-beta-D-mannosaminyltransferase
MCEKVEFLGLKINPWGFDTFLNKIEENIISRKYLQQVSSVNGAIVVYAHKDPNLKRAINNSWYVNADGMSVVWGLRFLGHKIPERASCPELFDKLIILCEKKGYKPYFLGAKEDVIKKTIENLKKKHPKLKIAGFRNGYFTEEEDLLIAEEIKKSKADMLFLGISSPKKELFVEKCLKIMSVPFTFGVGGVFDIIAGKTKRAPVWMQRIGMEWIYRLMQEPKRMWKRYLITNSILIYYLLRAKFYNKLIKSK